MAATVGRALDPLHALPPDVLADALGYLPVSDVHSVARVSRAWHQCTVHEPALWYALAHAPPPPVAAPARPAAAVGAAAAAAAAADRKASGAAVVSAPSRLCVSPQNPLTPDDDNTTAASATVASTHGAAAAAAGSNSAAGGGGGGAAGGWKQLFMELRGLNTSGMAYDLLERGVHASSTDHPSQGIGNLLNTNNLQFWSSTGSPDEHSHERLLFALCAPCCVVTELHLCVYEAHYQRELPIYGPRSIRVFVGFHEDTTLSRRGFHYISPEMPVENHARPQVFRIAPQLVCGAYVGVELIGRRTKQPSDDLYYTVLRYVRALGTPVGVMHTERPLLTRACVRFAMAQHAALFRALLAPPPATAAAAAASAASAAAAAAGGAPAKKPAGATAAAAATPGNAAAAGADSGSGSLDDADYKAPAAVAGAAAAAAAVAVGGKRSLAAMLGGDAAAAAAAAAAAGPVTRAEVDAVIARLASGVSSMAESAEKARGILQKIRAVMFPPSRGAGVAPRPDEPAMLMVRVADMVTGNLLHNNNARSEVIGWVEELAQSVRTGGGGGANAHANAARVVLMYLMLLVRMEVKLNHAESMAVGRVELALPGMHFLQFVMSRTVSGATSGDDRRGGLLMCTRELGDLLYAAGKGGDSASDAYQHAALRVYLHGFIPDKVVQCLVERGQPLQALEFCNDCDYTPDWLALLSRVHADPHLKLSVSLELARVLVHPDTAPTPPGVGLAAVAGAVRPDGAAAAAAQQQQQRLSPHAVLSAVGLALPAGEDALTFLDAHIASGAATRVAAGGAGPSPAAAAAASASAAPT